MVIGIAHFLTVSAILFTLGVFGIFLNRKNVIVMLMSIELILLSVNINFVAFSAVLGDLVGQVFTLFVLTVAAAEAARIGLALTVVPADGLDDAVRDLAAALMSADPGALRAVTRLITGCPDRTSSEQLARERYEQLGRLRALAAPTAEPAPTER